MHFKPAFTDVKLSGADPTSLGSFENDKDIELWQGIKPENRVVKEGRGAGRWENMHLNTSVSIRRIPHDWTKVEALEFWAHANEATGAKLQLILDSDQPNTSQLR